MVLLRFISWTCILLAANAALSADPRVTSLLEPADRILSEAPNLRSALENEDLWERYFHALEDLYGKGSFSRESFDAITNQLRIAIDKVPELEARLWETGDLGEYFSIESNITLSGRTLDPANWKTYSEKWLSGLKEKAKPYLGLDDAGLDAHITKIEEKIQKQIERTQLTEEEIKKTENGSVDPERVRFAKAMQALRANNEVENTAALLLYLHLIKPANAALMEHTMDADVLLIFLSQLRENPSLVWDFRELHDALIAAMRRMIQPKSDLLRDESIFPRIEMKIHRKSFAIGKLKEGVIEFIPVNRRIHGIWKGITIGECIGGNPAFKISLSPERWATIALKGSQLFLVVKDDSIYGFVQYVPIKFKDKIYGSVEVESKLLSHSILQKADLGDMLENVPVLELWFKEAMKNKPKNWEGFVVGEHAAFNNMGARGVLERLPIYFFGEKISTSNQFSHLDPIAKEIRSILPRRGYAKTYGGKMPMLFDAFIKSSGQLTLLTTPSESRVSEMLSTKMKVKAVLNDYSGEAAKWWQKKILKKFSNDPEMQSFLLKLALDRSSNHSFVQNSQSILLQINPTGPKILVEVAKYLADNNRLGESREWAKRLLGGTRSNIPEVRNVFLKLLDISNAMNEKINTDAEAGLDGLITIRSFDPIAVRAALTYLDPKEKRPYELQRISLDFLSSLPAVDETTAKAIGNLILAPLERGFGGYNEKVLLEVLKRYKEDPEYIESIEEKIVLAQLSFLRQTPEGRPHLISNSVYFLPIRNSRYTDDLITAIAEKITLHRKEFTPCYEDSTCGSDTPIDNYISAAGYLGKSNPKLDGALEKRLSLLMSRKEPSFKLILRVLDAIRGSGANSARIRKMVTKFIEQYRFTEDTPKYLEILAGLNPKEKAIISNLIKIKKEAQALLEENPGDTSITLSHGFAPRSTQIFPKELQAIIEGIEAIENKASVQECMSNILADQSGTQLPIETK